MFFCLDSHTKLLEKQMTAFLKKSVLHKYSVFKYRFYWIISSVSTNILIYVFGLLFYASFYSL